MVLLMAVTSAAAVLGLLTGAWRVLPDVTLVTGGSVGLSTVLALIPVVAFLVGLALGGRHALRDAAE